MLRRTASARPSEGRRLSALAAATLALVVGTGGLAHADNIQDTIADNGSGLTLDAGSATGQVAMIRLVGNNSGQDADDGCNIDGGDAPLVLDVLTPAGVTASPDPLSITSCGLDFPVTFKASATAVGGTATVAIVSGPAGGGSYLNQVSIPITVRATNTAPTVTVTGVGDDQEYRKSATPAPGCSVRDAEDSDESAVPQITNGAYNALGSHTVTCSYTDKGGLSDTESVTYTVIRDVDTSAPTVAHTLDPASPSGANGWYTGNVSLSWTVAEPQSPDTLETTGCGPTTVDEDQDATTYTCSASSEGGSAQDSVSIKRDSRAPNAPEATLSPAPNGAGWNNTDVVVSFKADGDNGPSGVATCTADTPVTDEGKAQVVTGTCTDNAGNTSPATQVTVDLDRTKPVISETVTVDGDEGTNGWYTSDVTVTFTATDNLSGFTTGGDSKQVTSSGQGTAVQVTSPAFTDKADNTTTPAGAVVKTFKIDKDAPNAPKYTVTPAPNAHGWNNTDVTVAFQAAGDNGPSGIASCTADVTVDTDTDGQVVTGTCTDTAGNESAPTTVTIKRDTQAPNAPTYTLNPEPNTAGWNKGNVTVDFEAAGDNGPSGIDTCTADVTVDTDTDGQVVTGTCTDKAGNESDPTTVTVKRDSRAPNAPEATLSPAPNGAGWNNTDVVVSFKADGDNGPSGVATCTADTPVTDEGKAQVVTGTCTDNAGNTSPATQVTVDLDRTKPVISETVTVDGDEGTNGWYTSDVTVTFTATDNLSGFTTGGDSKQVTSSGQGTAVQVTSPAFTDKADNTTTPAGAVVKTFKIDKDAPNAPKYTVTPAPNAHGWNNTDVTVAFQAAGDNGPSGIASCTADVTVDTDTDGQVVTGTCTDTAGNESAPTTVTIKRDTQAPNAPTYTLNPEPNTAGWNKGNVTVDFEAAGDNGPSGIDTCTSDVTVTQEGAGQTVTGTCTDTAGNVSSARTVTVNLDRTAPSVGLDGGPQSGASYVFGSVPATPSCVATDGLSGLDGTCSLSGYGTTVGDHTLTAVATDRAGNTRTVTRTYTVLAWTGKGYYAPVDMGGVYNTVKGGSTVPLKFELFAGTAELTDVAAVKSFQTQKITCSGDAVADAIEVLTTGGTSLRYDATGGQFIQNWKTPTGAGTCYRTTMTAQDGTTISALFKIK